MYSTATTHSTRISGVCLFVCFLTPCIYSVNMYCTILSCCGNICNNNYLHSTKLTLILILIFYDINYVNYLLYTLLASLSLLIEENYTYFCSLICTKIADPKMSSVYDDNFSYRAKLYISILSPILSSEFKH